MSLYNCGCGNTTPSILCSDNSGCPIQLDFDCIIYHKANNQIAALTNLSLNNGATLQLFAEAVDVKLGQLNVPTFSLPCLRQTYNINSLRQFAEAVDITLCDLKQSVADAITQSTTPLTVVDTNSIDLTATGNLFHTLQADLVISQAANNLISILNDGAYVTPQTLSINYTTKDLTLSNSNTVNLGSLVCGVGGFLGNLAADPSSIDGQYWWNSTSGQLKIRVAGLIKVISTT